MPYEPFQEHPLIRQKFPELHPPLTAQAAVLEANRCLNCFDAPCTSACPTHIDVPGFIKKIASGNLPGSARRILEANVLAASCSRVCPVEVLCEGACVMHGMNREPIQIAKLQRHAMDTFHQSGEPLLTEPVSEQPVKVVCIGAGPASLACAAELRSRGIAVTVLERRSLPGGLNTYGVAEYKLRTVESLQEIDLIQQMGVEFRFGTGPETEEDLTQLEREYDYIFIGVGLGAMQKLGLPGEDLPGVINALELIAAYKTGHITRLSGTAAVIGAGNTAIDAASAARRLGAHSVYILYRRTSSEMSAFPFEYEHARQEDVQFLWFTQPVAIEQGAHSLTLRCTRVQPSEAGLTPVPGSEFLLDCNWVIPAIGQSPLANQLAEHCGITIEAGRVIVNRATGQTENPRYFAGGDCVNGGREVVDAVADGKRAALGILAHMEEVYDNSRIA